MWLKSYVYVTLLNSKAHFMTIDRSMDGRTDGREKKKENTLVAYRPLSSLLRVAAVVVVVAIVVKDEEKLRLNSCCDRTLLLFYNFIYLKFSI